MCVTYRLFVVARAQPASAEAFSQMTGEAPVFNG